MSEKSARNQGFAGLSWSIAVFVWRWASWAGDGCHEASSTQLDAVDQRLGASLECVARAMGGRSGGEFRAGRVELLYGEPVGATN